MTGLRTTLLLPTALFMLLWGVYAVFLGQENQVSAAVPLAVLALLLVVSAVDIEVFLVRPLRNLRQGVQALGRSRFTGSPVAQGCGELRELGAGLAQLHERMQEYETRLATKPQDASIWKRVCASWRSATR